MTTLTEFPLFPLLPRELRLDIWAIVLSQPRTLVMHCERDKASRGSRFAKAFTSSTPPPAALHVCSESRHEGLSKYTPRFRTDNAPMYSRDDHAIQLPYWRIDRCPNYTYTSFEQDTVRCADGMLEYLGKEELACIQSLALEVRDSQYFAHFCMGLLKQMGSLIELELLTQRGVVYSWDRGDPLRFVQTLKTNFLEARVEDPAWVCPRVKISHLVTGEELAVVDGGALIPGWKLGDDVPEHLYT